MRGLIKRLLALAGVLGILFFLSPAAQAEEIIEISGVQELYDMLDRDTRELLDAAGAGEGTVDGGISSEGLFEELSRMVRGKFAAPLKALAGMVAVCAMGKLSGCFEEGGLTDMARLAAAAACGLLLTGPALELMEACTRTTEGAGAFLAAAVPVYAGLLAAGGGLATGSGYSFVALLAGDALPVLASGFLLPMLRVYLALAIAGAVSGPGLGRLAESLYRFGKWAMVAAVTVFVGVLSVQTAVNAQVDAAANKAAKLALSTGVPIVGGALGDAAAAIQNSLHMVRSGAGAFGILAALCLFAPTAIECLLWTGVCMAGQAAAEVLELSQAGAVLGAFGGVLKMVLAVLASVCVVCVVTAGAVVFVTA